jgi:hypothetical protein
MFIFFFKDYFGFQDKIPNTDFNIIIALNITHRGMLTFPRG